VPLVLVGHANGKLAGNTHLRCPDGTPMANVLLTMLQKLGMATGSFGDSTQALAI
jgi:hypothetical protein